MYIYIFFSLYFFPPSSSQFRGVSSNKYVGLRPTIFDKRALQNVYIKIWRKPCLIYNFTRKAYTVKYIIASRAKRYISHTITSYDYIAQHPYDLRVDDTVDNKGHEVFFFFFLNTRCALTTTPFNKFAISPLSNS